MTPWRPARAGKNEPNFGGNSRFAQEDGTELEPNPYRRNEPNFAAPHQPAEDLAERTQFQEIPRGAA